jgi:hypothetical protein
MGVSFWDQGCIEVLLAQLSELFGTLPPGTEERLEAMTSQELLQLGKKLLRPTSLQELGLELSGNQDSA